MGRYQLRFVICTLYIILQCNMSKQTPIVTNNRNAVEIRIPVDSNNNKDSAPQNQQFWSNPYSYYTQLSQCYANLFNNCNCFLCNNKCSNSNPILFKSPSNPNSRRIKVIIENRSAAKPAPDATVPAPNNGDTPAPDTPVVPPVDEQQAKPVTPDTDTPPATPPVSVPPADVPPPASPPADAPPPASPPAGAPPTDAPPAGAPPGDIAAATSQSTATAIAG